MSQNLLGVISAHDMIFQLLKWHVSWLCPCFFYHLEDSNVCIIPVSDITLLSNCYFNVIYAACLNKHKIVYIVIDETIKFTSHVSWAAAFSVRKNNFSCSVASNLPSGTRSRKSRIHAVTNMRSSNIRTDIACGMGKSSNCLHKVFMSFHMQMLCAAGTGRRHV
jgi:hypothetical protein